MKYIKKPDLNGPRFKSRRVSVLTAKTLEKFKEKYPQYKDVTISGFKKIIMTFNANLTEGIIENRNGVELPDGLGYIFMGTCPKPKKKNIDFKRSIDYGVEAIHKRQPNHHLEGRVPIPYIRVHGQQGGTVAGHLNG